MSDIVRNGAPYQLVVSFPGQKKESIIYTYPDADSLVEGVGTLALIHVKRNIRGRTGERTMFEVIAKPVEEQTITQVFIAEVSDADVPG